MGDSHYSTSVNRCMWPMSHRDKRHARYPHACGCTCWLDRGHSGRHLCNLEVDPT